MKPYRIVQVGTGGIGRGWCTNFLPPFVASGRVEVVAAVDINPDALESARHGLALDADRCYNDLASALAEHPADACVLAIPPMHREEAVDVALQHGLHILMEKPVADNWPAAARIASRAASCGAKVAVALSHRFDRDKTTFREEMRASRNGRLDYLACRYISANRKRDSWGGYRHRMPNPVLVEGGTHHIDILVDLAGARCSTVSSISWNPPWGEYEGHSEVLAVLDFANGVKAVCEGSKVSAVNLNGVGQEYLRAQCENATIVMDRRRIERFAPTDQNGPELSGTQVPLASATYWGHQRIIHDFLDWLDGGATAPTAIDRHLHACAVVFAAVESSRRGAVVEVAELESTIELEPASSGE